MITGDKLRTRYIPASLYARDNLPIPLDRCHLRMLERAYIVEARKTAAQSHYHERERKLRQEIKTHQRHELHVGRPCVHLHYHPRHLRPLYPATRALPRSCLSPRLARHVRCRGLSWGRNTLLCSASIKKRKKIETLGEEKEEEKKYLTRERRTDFSPADISKVQQQALLQRVIDIFTGYPIW